MSLPGHVQNGVVVFDAAVPLPDGNEGEHFANCPAAGRSLRHAGLDAAATAARSLRETGYDFDAWQSQCDFDLTHAADHPS